MGRVFGRGVGAHYNDRMKPLCPIWVPFVLCCALACSTVRAADETAESAAWLLKKSTLIHQSGLHNILLRSLRQMNDPSLKPLFSALVQNQKRHPTLRIHGILGLGEIESPSQIDLALIADTKDVYTQAQLVSAGMESKLLSVDQAKQLVGWPGIDISVKVIAASWLVGEKSLPDGPLLDEALASDKLPVKALASLLKLQKGDAKAMATLQELDATADANRDEIRALLLQTAIRYKLDAVAPWAMKIASEPATPQPLMFLALRCSLMFKAPQASSIWSQRYESSTSPADRIRLAILALDLADRVEQPKLELLTRDSQPVIQQIGAVALLRHAGQNADQQTLQLIDHNNILASQWAVQDAVEQPIEKSKPILVGLIRSAEAPNKDPRGKAQRLEHVVMAAQELAEKAPDAKAIFADLLKDAPALTQEAMLMGLIRSKVKQADQLVVGHAWPSDVGQSLSLLLRLKHGGQPTPEEMQQLQLMVRGGAGLQDPLRIQAAWIYLKLTKQEQIALASVLGP
jgi:hypothetical protein